MDQERLADLWEGRPGGIVVTSWAGGSVEDVMATGRASQPQDSIDERAVFEAASLTKPLIALITLRLVSSGAIDLDQPMQAEALKRKATPDARLEGITPRRVLSHTTGFPNWRSKGEPLTLERAPGQQFGYSGEGFEVLLELLRRHATGRFVDWLDTHLRDAGMTDSSFVWRRRFNRRVALGHDAHGKQLRKRRPRRPRAAGSLHTTPRDYATFLGTVISESKHAPFSEMRIPAANVDTNRAWTLGWGFERQAAREVLWQHGYNPGFRHLAAIDTSRQEGVVVFTSSEAGQSVLPTIVEDTLGVRIEP